MIRLALLLALLGACAPVRVPVDVAETQCRARAEASRDAVPAAPIGISVGPGSNAGFGAGVETIRRVDPGAVYTRCMVQKTGQPSPP